MAPERTGGLLRRNGKLYARIRVATRRRVPLLLVGCASEKEAKERIAEAQGAVNRLLDAGKGSVAEQTARKLVAASSPEVRALLLRVVDQAVRGERPERGRVQAGITVEEFGKQWTSGKLHEKWPDHVPAKEASSAKRDAGILKRYVVPEIGSLPLAAVDLGHVESVMATVPAKRATASRRHVAQVMHRLLGFAVYPAKLLATNPIPDGFLPRLGRPRATGYLYPREDLALMACADVALVRRLLYGLLHREGMRAEEALSLEWTDLDLEAGSVRLDKNKSKDPRTWALDPGVHHALLAWRDMAPEHPRVFGKRPIPARGADGYRDDVARAGIARPELTAKTKERRPLRMHDTRTAFVTIALSSGKSEVWVMDRTGHRSSAMVQRYRRGARLASELGLGSWAPLDEAIPEFRRSGSDRDPSRTKRSEVSRKLLKSMGLRGRPVRAQRIQNPPGFPRESSSLSFGTHSGKHPHVGHRDRVGDPDQVPDRRPDDVPWPYVPGQGHVVLQHPIPGIPRVLPLRVRARVVPS